MHAKSDVPLVEFVATTLDTSSGRGALALILAILPVVAGCRGQAQTEFDRPPAPVTVVAAVAQDVPVYLDAIGKTAAREVVSIQPQVSGPITGIHFADGADVRKGDLLFTIDPRPLEASLKEAKANLAKSRAAKKQAEATLAKDLAQAKFGEAQSRRYGALMEQAVVSREQYEQQQANSDTLNATVEADRAAVRSADEAIRVDEAAVESANVQLGYCSIRSPIDGRAGERLVDVGNVVNPGNLGAPTPLLVIQRLDPIYADFTVSQNDLTAVQRNLAEGSLQAEVRLPDDPGNAVVGELTFLDNAVQNTTGTVGLRVTLPNKDRRFWPGRFVNVRLILRTLHGAVLVPSAAPQTSANGPFVYVVKEDSTAEQRAVTLGQTHGDLVVIETGISAGESVVTNGQLGVTPGGKVRVDAPPGAGGSPPAEPRSAS